MTLRTRVRNLEAKAPEKLDIAQALLEARKRHQQGIHRPPMTDAEIREMARTKLGRQVLAARSRLRITHPDHPKGTP